MPSRVRLLEVDSEFAERVGPRAAEVLRDRLIVATETLPPGVWAPQPRDPAPIFHLLLDGLLAQDVAICGGVTTQVLGPGALFSPTADPGYGPLQWRLVTTALVPSRVALIDPRVAGEACRHPELCAGIFERALETARDASLVHAIATLNRLETRLLALLWHLAERFGRVARAGTVLDMPLSHRLLAQMVGAKRPSVTTALRHLTERGSLTRRPDGAWLLLGDPAPELEQLATGAQSFSRPAPARARRLSPVPSAHDGAAAKAGGSADGAGFDRMASQINDNIRRLHEDYARQTRHTRETLERAALARAASEQLRRSIASRRDEQAS